MLASYYGSYEVLCLLLDKGSYVNQQASDDMSSPLHCAAEGNSSMVGVIVSKLLQHGAISDLVDIHGKRPADLLMRD